MPSVINQSEIPTLSLLYSQNKLSLSPEPIFAPSATLNSKIGLIRADITKLHLPNGAIVNAANESLSPGAGVCGAIHNAAGRELAEDCHRLRECQTGHAKMTKAYRLPCKRVIHAVGPIYWKAGRDNEHSESLAGCYTETLKLCVQDGLTAVAFCALSTGIYGYPSYEAAETALQAVRRFLETEEGEKMELVVFCNFEKKDENAYHELIPNYFPPPKLTEETTKEAEASETSETTETTKLDEATDGAADAKPSKPKPTEPVSSEPTPSVEELKEVPKKETAPEDSKPVNPGGSDDADDFVLVDKEDAEK